MEQKIIKKILHEILFIECEGYKGEEERVISLYNKAMEIAENNNLDREFLYNYALYLKVNGMYSEAKNIANRLLNYYKNNNLNEERQKIVEKFIESI